MSIKKRYLKRKGVCQVTFAVSKIEGEGSRSVHVVGEFNNWSTTATPMKRLHSGGFTTSLELRPGQRYQFRYLFDGHLWDNEKDADDFAETPFFDARNSVLDL